MLTKILKKTGIFSLLAFCIALATSPVRAEVILQVPDDGFAIPGSNDNVLLEVAYVVIQFALTIAGSLAVIGLIIGGYLYISSAGSTERIELAKKTVTYSVISLVVILIAFTIVATLNTIFS